MAPTASPFHAGEREVQTRVGVRERIERAGGRFVRQLMPDQHRELFAQLDSFILPADRLCFEVTETAAIAY